MEQSDEVIKYDRRRRYFGWVKYSNSNQKLENTQWTLKLYFMRCQITKKQWT